MEITLTVDTTSLTLHPDLFWSDESWLPVEQSATRTIKGALVVSVAARVGGRPITLQPEDDTSAWMSRTTLEQLREWGAIPGQQMTLSMGGVVRTVIFRHDDSNPAVEATPVVFFSTPAPDDKFRITLRFTEE
jgi:hypothetical protein